MAINITLDGTGDSPLKKQLDERAAANRAALNSRNEDRRNEEKINETAAVTRTQEQEQQDKKKNNATLAKLKPEEQTASIRGGGGFQFYYTFSEVLTGNNVREIATMRSTYQTLVNRYGDAWPTGVVEINQISPAYRRGGIVYDSTSFTSYSTAFGGFVLSQLSRLNSVVYPEALEAPFTQLQVKPVSPPTVANGQVPPQSSVKPLLGGFPGSLGSGYTRKDNIMFAVGPDFLWDAPGWPAPFDPRPPDGPPRDDFPSIRTSVSFGGNGIKFPLSYRPSYTFVSVTPRRPFEFPHSGPFYRFCSPTNGPFPCIFLTSISFIRGDYYNEFYRGALSRDFYTEPGFESGILVGFPEYVGTTPDFVIYKPSQAVSFRPALLTTAQEASSRGFVIAHLFLDQGVFSTTGIIDSALFPYKYTSGRDVTTFNFVTEAFALGINILDFSTPLAPSLPSNDPRRDRFKNYVDTQYPIAKKIETMIENPNQTFFSLLKHSIGTKTTAGLIPVASSDTPYSNLYSALELLRFLTRLSFSTSTSGGIFAQIDTNIVGAPYTAETRARLKELELIRRKTARAMVAQYLGRETVEAIRTGDFNSAAARGKLQG